MHPTCHFARRRPRLAAAAAAAALGAALAQAPAVAAPLDPLGYGSLGTLSLGAGHYTLNTSGATPSLLDASLSVLYTGVLQAQADAYNSQIAVFAFDSISVAPGVTINASGSHPVALLSRSGISFAGTLDATGRLGGNQGAGTGGAGGPGAGRGGNGGFGVGESGFGPGGGLGGFGGLGNGSWGEGGAFGGLGSNINPARTPAQLYGDLAQTLQAGSGGGASGVNLFGSGAGGGGGGGGVELGAASFITLAGGSKLLAHGGEGGGGLAIIAGGGSGGGVLLHAPLIELQGSIAGPAVVDASGAPVGSGGRIAFFTGDALVQGNLASVTVAGGSNGHPGVITYSALSPVPEPASALLMLCGAAALLAQRRRLPAVPAPHRAG